MTETILIAVLVLAVGFFLFLGLLELAWWGIKWGLILGAGYFAYTYAMTEMAVFSGESDVVVSMLFYGLFGAVVLFALWNGWRILKSRQNEDDGG